MSSKAHCDGIVAFSQTDFTQDLKKINAPVLVMHGEGDQVVPYADAGPLMAAMVKEGGVMVSTVGGANPELEARAGIRGVNMGQERSAADLSELAGLVERGDVKPRMGDVYPLEQAREAQDASQQGRAKGKILLKIA